MNRTLIITFFFQLAFSASQGQDQDIITSYSTENGLPSNGILGMQWDDRTNFLWVATEAGLVRYNGIDFKVFTKENTPEIATDRMVFLIRDHNGKIFTADRLRNSFIIENNKVSFFRKFPNELDKPGNLFLIATSESFSKKNLNRQNKYNYYLPFDRIATLNDSACLIRKDSMIIRYDVSGEREISLPQDRAEIKRIFKIDGLFFLSTRNGKVYLFDPYSEKTSRNSIMDENGQEISLADNENLIYWENGMKNPILLIGSKAWILSYENGRIRARLFTSSIPENTFINFCQYSKKHDILFIGTDSKGIVIIRKKKLHPVKSKELDMLQRNAIYGQLELDNGNILTNEGKELGDQPRDTGALPIKGGFFFSVFDTGDSTIWYAKHGDLSTIRLHQYDQTTRKTRTYNKIRFTEQAPVLRSGNEYYITTVFGIGKINGDSLEYLYRFPVQNSVYDLVEYRPGIFLIPSCGGLLRYRLKDNKLDTLLEAGENCIRSVRLINDKYVFIGTYGRGIFVWDGDSVKALPLDKNKYLLYAHCFVPDKFGFCWISTNKGLFKAKTDEMIKAFHRPAEQLYYHYYGKNDGMDITELNGGCQPCALALRNGTLSFPSMDGLLWVDPGKTQVILPNSEIFIDDIFVDGRLFSRDSLKNISLPAGTRDITISLGLDGWAGRENIYLQYKLDEERGWRNLNPNNNSDIRLSNLSSGQYSLQIRKLKGFESGQYQTITIQFTIKTPWYNTAWFFIVAGICLSLLILFSYRWRLWQLQSNQLKLEKQVAEKTIELQHKNDVLEKANSIKNRLISVISHDIITPLKFLNVAGKNLLDKKNTMPEALQRETIEEMTNTARELHFLSTNVLNLIKYQSEKKILNKEKFMVSKLVEDVFGVLRATAAQKKLKLVNNINPKTEIYQFYDLLRILVYNLILNGINFSDKGDITVNYSGKADEALITVTDEGIGMSADQINNLLSDDYIISSANTDKRKGNGLGYLIIKDLAAMMKAEISIQSEPGKGTSVGLRFPVKRKK